jgi:hypothetical protein
MCWHTGTSESMRRPSRSADHKELTRSLCLACVLAFANAALLAASGARAPALLFDYVAPGGILLSVLMVGVRGADYGWVTRTLLTVLLAGAGLRVWVLSGQVAFDAHLVVRILAMLLYGATFWFGYSALSGMGGAPSEVDAG